MAIPRVTQVPAQPRQRRHASTSTHGSPGKTREHARCPNLHPRSRYLQDPASYARPRGPGPSAVSHSPLLRLRLHNLHHHDHLINHHHHVSSSSTPPPRPRGTPPKRASKPAPTAGSPAAAKAHAPTKPTPTTQPQPKTAAKRPPKPVSTQPAATPKPKPKPGATTAARARPPEDVLYDIRPQPSQAQRQQRPARRPPTVTDATATTFMAERAAAEARRTSSRHLSKPTPQAHGPLPTKPERRQGPPAASLPPYRPSMTAHMQRMPHYRRRRNPPPNPEADTVRAHPRVHIRVHPHSPRTPTEQDYEESPRPANAAGPHDPVTPTHAHSSAQDRRPAQEQWWQRWTHTQADALHPLGVQPRNLPAPQDHPYVLRRLRETLQETQRDGICLWDITQSPAPHAHTPSPPHKRRRTDNGDTHSTPGALRATQHDAPDPPASGAAI